jgi:ABC-type multidrug transport system ATPase subunit
MMLETGVQQSESRQSEAGVGRVRRVVASGLIKRFGSSVALRGVDITLDAGLVTVIEGPNGSGKTTLLGILGTMVRPTAGKVLYEPLGEDVTAVRAELGWVSHDTLSYGDLSGKQNIELAAELHGLDVPSTWVRVQERFELGAFAGRPLRTNSRGQRQRVALARALAHGPSLLLLDEPTTGLDRTGIALLLRVVEEEASEGCVVGVVSHEPELFRKLETRRVCLERGRVVSEA